MLLTDFTQRKSKFCGIFKIEDVFTTWRKIPVNIRFLSTLPQNLGDRGAIFLDDCISKGQFPGLRERHFLVEKLARRFFFLIYISKGQRMNLQL